MVQQPRQEEPLYGCVVPIDSVTGRQDEEIMTQRSYLLMRPKAKLSGCWQKTMDAMTRKSAS